MHTACAAAHHPRSTNGCRAQEYHHSSAPGSAAVIDALFDNVSGAQSPMATAHLYGCGGVREGCCWGTWQAWWLWVLLSLASSHLLKPHLTLISPSDLAQIKTLPVSLTLVWFGWFGGIVRSVLAEGAAHSGGEESPLPDEAHWPQQQAWMVSLIYLSCLFSRAVSCRIWQLIDKMLLKSCLILTLKLFRVEISLL